MTSKLVTATEPVSKASFALWTAQGLLALLFLLAGAIKLMLPIEVLTQQSSLPGGLLRFIGLAETVGAIGLILPGLMGIAPWLTAWAAAGLVVIMIGATALALPGGAAALIPFTVGALAAIVAYGRRGCAPPRQKESDQFAATCATVLSTSRRNALIPFSR